MANIKYSDLLTEVLPNLCADPSDPVTENAIKRSVIEFCAESWIWRYLPDAIDVTAGEAFYDLEAETGSDVTIVLDASYNGFQIENKSTEWLTSNKPGWRTNRATPEFFTQVDGDQLILAPVPDTSLDGALLLTMVLQPSQSSTSFPKWIFNQFIYTLADGAIAKLMLMPEKPWTDLKNGMYRRQQFEAGIANARASAAMAQGRAALRTTPNH